MITLYDIRKEFDSKNIRYRVTASSKSIVLEEPSNVVLTGLFVLISDKDEDGVISINILLTKLLNGVTDPIRDKLNELNKTYRYYSFFQEEDNVWLKTTAMVSENSDCQEIIDLIIMGIKTAEEVYPQIRKLILTD